MLCQNCGERPGTETWTESTLALVHGLSARWCQPCVYRAQLAHARKMAAEIPALEALLAQAVGVATNGDLTHD